MGLLKQRIARLAAAMRPLITRGMRVGALSTLFVFTAFLFPHLTMPLTWDPIERKVDVIALGTLVALVLRVRGRKGGIPPRRNGDDRQNSCH